MEDSVSVWNGSAFPLPSFLSGSEGELVSVRIAVHPRGLEDLLDCLAGLPFPVNPEIRHGVPTTVECPAWASSLARVEDALRSAGFEADAICVRPMLAALSVS